MFQQRLSRFQTRLADANIDVAMITDDDNVYYLTGYYDYLHMEFGRIAAWNDGMCSPSMDLFRSRLIARRSGDSFIITDDGWEPLTSHPKSVQEVIL